jgi:hypothetical protein
MAAASSQHEFSKRGTNAFLPQKPYARGHNPEEKALLLVPEHHRAADTVYPTWQAISVLQSRWSIPIGASFQKLQRSDVDNQLGHLGCLPDINGSTQTVGKVEVRTCLQPQHHGNSLLSTP